MDTVLVYDDDREEAVRRSRRAEALLAAMHRDGDLSEIPQLETQWTISGCYRVLEKDLEPSSRTLLIADVFTEDQKPRGARLLRATALRAGVATRTWRIALTRKAHPDVANALQGFAHALVVFPPDYGTEELRRAITDVMTKSPQPTGEIAIYPEDLSKRYDASLLRALQLALRVEMPSAEEARMALEVVRPRQNGMWPGPMLEKGQQPEPREPLLWKSTPAPGTKLYAQMRKRYGAHIPNDDLHRILDAHLKHLKYEGPAQYVSPHEVALGVKAARRVLRRRGYGPLEAVKDGLWLTQKELDLANVFFGYVEAHPEQGKAGPKSYQPINSAFTDPDFIAEREDLHGTNFDVAYAVISVAEWWQEREEARFLSKLDPPSHP